MTPYHADPWLTVYLGDCREVLATLPAESVHCVVTSPPYWGLRDYGTASWVGGDEACDHTAGPLASAKSGLQRGKVKDTDKVRTNSMPQKGVCRKCGAVRQDAQLGLEPTPEQYVENMVAVFREVRRVLRSDGTVWLNLGDSYATGAAGNKTPSGLSQATPKRAGKLDEYNSVTRDWAALGLKPKDLVGIPWRVAFALQADGWYLRSDIIWSKPNPMPESVTDRPTKSHEYLFLLSKSPRYYFDADAVREPLISTDEQYLRAGKSVRENHAYGEVGGRPLGPSSFATVPSGRNIRTVWTIATQPYPGAHFATFPRKLVEPCIKAGCPTGGVVLDPFAGSGTTALVAQSLSRRAVLIDLNGEYLEQVMDRNRDMPLGLGA